MDEAYRAQHRQRMSWMPFLYFRLKPHDREWARAWQAEIQARLIALEAVDIGEGCFVAPEAGIFAEPRRRVVIGDGCSIAAEAFLHGPIELASGVSINHRCSLDGGAGGIRIGERSRIAHGVSIYAFDHGLAPDRFIDDQPVSSRGIDIGSDCWIGAQSCITDGVRIGDHAVVGMGSVVTRDVPPYTIVAGNPARPIGDRRERGV